MMKGTVIYVDHEWKWELNDEQQFRVWINTDLVISTTVEIIIFMFLRGMYM